MLPFLPMLPVQVLVQNLCFDACQLTLAYDRAAAAERPRTFSPAELARFAIVLGIVNAAADVVTFAILRQLIGPHADPAVFRAGWFAENMLSQAVAIHLLRRGTLQRQRSGHRGLAAARRLPVLLGTAGLAAAGLLLPLSPLAGLLGMRPYPAAFLPLLGCTLAGFCLATLAALALTRRPRQRRRGRASLT
jgi:Mg2+-importing ATPase